MTDPDRVARPYRSPVRTAQAEATRTRICAAAAPLFAEQGYIATSVRQLAVAAGVSVETLYGLGGKAAVFLRSFELAFSGTPDGASLLDLDVLQPTWAAATLDEVLTGMVGFIVDSNERSAGLWSAYIAGANHDPDLAAAYAARMQAMREDGRRVLAHVVGRGLCPAPADAELAVDEVWVTLHPSQYVLLVGHAGWSRDRYRLWLQTSVRRVLTG